MVNVSTFRYRWERRVDARGRTYYVDHNSRTTTWQRPTVESVNNYNQWRSNQERNVSREREQYQQRYLSVVIRFLHCTVGSVTYFDVICFEASASCSGFLFHFSQGVRCDWQQYARCDY